jgi:hypothetical protein
MHCRFFLLVGSLSLLWLFLYPGFVRAQDRTTDPLPSWNDGPAKQAIVGFVDRVTTEGSPDFLKLPERIAVFDNDGTLWCEQPLYVQLAFVVDRIKTMAPDHPEWSATEPFKSLLANDFNAVAAQGEKALMRLMAATHAGLSVDEYSATVAEWIATAKHPATGWKYTEMVYEPMIELLGYLRDAGFKTFIVSGGGADFIRPWAQKVYGIPNQQVIGSRVKLKYELRDGTPTLMKLPEIDLVDDGPGKPVGIQQVIGRRPVMAFGNSDGDFEMLEWTTAGPGARFGLIVRHTDASREWSYDRDSPIGRLAKALDEAPRRGWIVVDMKSDWKRVFAVEDD